MLPFVCDPAVAIGSSRAFPNHGRIPTILLVEDEPLVRELAVEMLENEGCRVLTAASAEDALAIMYDVKPDLLFTDIDLGPGLDGLALARAARSVLPDLPVIYASGGRPALGAGEAVVGSAFLPKPYRSHQVRGLIGPMLTALDGRVDA
jgi:CheY-like chemotaxis protein